MSSIMNQLQQLHRQDAIEDIDIELCRFFKRLEPGISRDVLLAACLASCLYREGDVCLTLDDYAGQLLFNDEVEGGVQAPGLDRWQDTLSDSSLVGDPGDFTPLILDSGNRLYLHKLWHHEDILARTLLERCINTEQEIDLSQLAEGLGRLFSSEQEDGTDWQQVAAALAVKHQLSVISGGPGTGKTSTVVRILALLAEQGIYRGQMLSIALTAPTGKAAARLQESILSAKRKLPVSDAVKEAIPGEAVTLHQLMGARRHTSQFKHDKENPIPRDVVVIDEASMVDQALMSRLMEALAGNTKLILLGDKDQLASVEAGSVLGDICMLSTNRFSKSTADWLTSLQLKLPANGIVPDPKPLTDHVTLLTRSYRFKEDSGIARLADRVNRGEADDSLALLRSTKYPEIRFMDSRNVTVFKKFMQQKTHQYFQPLFHCRSPEEAFELLQDFRILAAHRKGPWGIQYLNRYIEQILHERGAIFKYQRWYDGMPVIINRNDHSLGLHNGDTGICLSNNEGESRIYFRHKDSTREVAPARLPDHNKAYALTVHKSQGSEFNNVLLILPDTYSKIVNRELIYTAITRARQSVTILAPEQVLRRGIQKQMQRKSGLADRLWH